MPYHGGCPVSARPSNPGGYAVLLGQDRFVGRQICAPAMRAAALARVKEANASYKELGIEPRLEGTIIRRHDPK